MISTNLRFLPGLILPAFFLIAVSTITAEEKAKRIQFERGKSETIVTGKVTGRGDVLYKLNARDGQFLQVKMLPGSKGADFNIFIPGRAPGDEAMYASAIGGRNYLGQFYKTGDHSILARIDHQTKVRLLRSP